MVSIAILGANGFIGRNSCRFFSDAGYSVLGLVRDPSKEEAVRVNGAQPRVVDYKSVKSLSDSFTGIDVVLDLVGSGWQTPNETYEQSNIINTRNIVLACQEKKVRKFVYNSGLGVRETNTNGYFVSRFLAEKEITKTNLDYTIFRPSYIIGEDDLLFLRHSKQIKSGMVNVYGSGKYRMQPISIDDVLTIFQKAIENEKHSRKIYDLIGPEAITFLDYIDTISKHLNLNPEINFIPLEEAMQDNMKSRDPQLSFDQLVIRICDELSDAKRLEEIFDINLKKPQEVFDQYLKSSK